MAMQQQIVGDADAGYLESRECPQCYGRGYHHGFGELGHDPDWCSMCGGPGTEWLELLTPYET